MALPLLKRRNFELWGRQKSRDLGKTVIFRFQPSLPLAMVAIITVHYAVMKTVSNLLTHSERDHAQKRVYETFQKSKPCLDAFDNLLHRMFWQPGTYSIRAVLSTLGSQQFTKDWSFTITDSDYELIRTNLPKIMQDAVGLPNQLQYFNVFPQYSSPIVKS